MGSLPSAVSDYYKSVPDSHRETFLEMRKRILEIMPKAKEAMKYGMPTFFLNGEAICGIMAHKRHIGFYPYSGSILGLFPELAEKFETSSGALRLPPDKPLTKSLLRKLIRARINLTSD
jgi:uncharacterized protein YdhG (YjbR/CyaY superfamily)